MYVDTIKRSTAFLLFICSLLCLGLFRICLFSNTIFKAYSLLILSVLLFCVIFKKKRVFRNLLPLALAAVVAFSVLYNNPTGTGAMNAVTYFLEFLAPFVVLDYLTDKFGLGSTLHYMMMVSLGICLLMDFSVIAHIDFDKSHYQNLITYLFGNKFMVAYLHMQTLGLYAAHKNVRDGKMSGKTLIAVAVFGCYSVLLCKYVNCATGMIGNFVIMCMILFPFTKSMKKFFSRSSVMMLIMLVTNTLIVTSDKIVQLPIFKLIIVHVLHKNVTLTGRYRIYKMLPALILDRPLTGYGYNINIFTELLGYGNAQNGFLQYAVDCGILGAILLILVWIYCMRGTKGHTLECWPLVCSVYGFMVASLVEVCFKFNFFVILAMIACFSFARDQKKE